MLTGDYDIEIEVELRGNVIVESVGIFCENNPADLEERKTIAVEKLKLQLKGLTH